MNVNTVTLVIVALGVVLGGAGCSSYRAAHPAIPITYVPAQRDSHSIQAARPAPPKDRGDIVDDSDNGVSWADVWAGP